MSHDGYSATVLGTHWVSWSPGPAGVNPSQAGTVAAQAGTVAAGLGATLVETPVAPGPGDVAPDRVDGSVLRFGPGVTAAAVTPFPVVVGCLG